MKVELVYDNVSNQLSIPVDLLPESGRPHPHHFRGTPHENLAELCGRICYDSCKSEKGRASEEYHKHIQEVGHLSVLEHCCLIFDVDCSEIQIFVGRPGVIVNYCTCNRNRLRICVNFRSIEEWDKYIRFNPIASQLIGDWLKNEASKIAPLIFPNPPQLNVNKLRECYLDPSIVLTASLDDEIWASFYIGGVSRNLTHELVRHGDNTAISQRSTRYVDESESPWIQHPLYNEYIKEYPTDSMIGLKDELISDAQFLYRNECVRLQDWLIGRGVDKFTALKQSRAAARSNLGTCLETELIFSANLTEWKHIISMRASRHADAEIRLMANAIFEQLLIKFPLIFGSHTKTPCPDGIGYEVSFA